MGHGFVFAAVGGGFGAGLFASDFVGERLEEGAFVDAVIAGVQEIASVKT